MIMVLYFWFKILEYFVCFVRWAIQVNSFKVLLVFSKQIGDTNRECLCYFFQVTKLDLSATIYPSINQTAILSNNGR